MSSPAVSESMFQQHTATHRARQMGMVRPQTTVPFHSTLPRSPTPGQVQQQQHHLAYGSGRTEAATTTTGQSPTMTTQQQEMMASQSRQRAAVDRRLDHHPHPQPQLAAQTTSTGPEAGLNLDGSPSWSSAMTPTFQGPLFYPYQAQDPQDPQRHLAGSSSRLQLQQQQLQSQMQQQQEQQEQPYPPQQVPPQQQGQRQQGQQQREETVHQVDLQAGARSHMVSMDLEDIQQYVAMAQAQAQAGAPQLQQQYYLGSASTNNNNSSSSTPRAHQARFRMDGEVPGVALSQQVPPGAVGQGQGHPPTPTSALTPATAYSSPPAMIKYESPSLRAGALQLPPE